MFSKEKLKENIIKLNNLILSILLFYIGISVSSLMWKINNFFSKSEESGWKETDEEMNNIEEMERMW